jgi:hypothetical protein
LFQKDDMNSLYDWLVVPSLRKLYFGGPQLYGYGFWAGRQSADICAELTKVPAQFWSEQTEECAHLLDHQFGALSILVETGLYALIAWKLVTFLTKALCWKLRLAPESWPRTPPYYPDRRKRKRSPQPKRRN